MNWLPIVLLLLGAASAQELTKERLWTGTNGKTFRGIFIRSLPDGEKVEIASAEGKIFSIALENLSKPDQNLIEATTRKKGEPMKVANDQPPVDFKPLPAVSRVYLSKVPNKPDGFKWPNSVTQAVGSFFYLWDLSGIVEIPRRGDADKKCDWLTDQLKRKLSPRNSNLASSQEVIDGIAHYFNEELKNKATFRCHQEIDVNLESIAKYTQGADACFLNVSNDGWGIWFPVIDVQGKDIIRVAYEGKILMLKWKPAATDDKTPRSGSKRFDNPTLEVLNKNDTPSHWAGDELIFKVSSAMVVCRPYVFAEEGKIGPPPADPDFGPQNTQP